MRKQFPLDPEKLMTERGACGRTQEELAKALGVEPKTVSNWETGKTRPGYPMAGRLAEYFGKEIEDLMAAGRGSQHTDALRRFKESLLSTGAAMMDGEALSDVACVSPSTLDEYRLVRVAHWSSPKHELDKRFVKLSLTTARSVSSLATGHHRDLPYDDLRSVIDSSEDCLFVLLGKPGCGKTTLLRRLQFDEAVDRLRDGKEQVSLYVELNQFPRGSPTAGYVGPGAWLAERWNRRYPDLPTFDTLVHGGKLLLLLDALNEIPHSSLDEFVDRVDAWRRFLREAIMDFPGNRAVVSARIQDYTVGLASPDVPVLLVTVQSLDNNQVKGFVTSYAPESGASLLEGLDEGEEIPVPRTPYFLRLLLEQVDTGREPPKGRASLFTGFLRQALRREIGRGSELFLPGDLLSESDHRKLARDEWGNECDLPAEGQLIPGLSRLAFQMQQSVPEGESMVVRAEGKWARDTIGGKSDDIIKAGAALGVIEECPVSAEVMFSHQLLQEFFAAIVLSRSFDASLVAAPWRKGEVTPTIEDSIHQISEGVPLPRLPRTGWEETTLLAAEITEKTNDFVRGVAEVNLPLAGDCIAMSEVHCSERVSAEILGSLVGRSQNAEVDVRARIEAGLALGAAGDPRFEARTGPDGTYLYPPMRSVATGAYRVGSNEESFPAESPIVSVELDEYRIGTFPVTNAEFAHFVRAGGYENELWWDTEDAISWLRNEGIRAATVNEWRRKRDNIRRQPQLPVRLLQEGRITLRQAAGIAKVAAMSDDDLEAWVDRWMSQSRHSEPAFWRNDLFNNGLKPIVGVCWFEVQAYCNWLKAQAGEPFRLPSEDEWEVAAGGKKQSRYPYGDELSSAFGNTVEGRIGCPTPVGVFPEGASPFGCLDMSGNVFEWVASAYSPRRGVEVPATGGLLVARGCRGGSWRHTGLRARCAYRGRGKALTRNDDLGFRLCCS